MLFSDPLLREPEWRISQQQVLETLPAGSNHELFTPKQKPEYKNRIINHLMSIDETIEGRMVVLQTGINPRRDYVFLDNSLCIILYQWDDMPGETLSLLLHELERQYGQPQTGADESLPSLSYRNNKSCALLIKRQSSGKGTDVRLYLYPKNLFYILLQH